MVLKREEFEAIRSGAAYYEGDPQPWMTVLSDILTCFPMRGSAAEEMITGGKSKSYPGFLMRSFKSFALYVHRKQDWQLHVSSEVLVQIYGDYLEQLCERSGMVIMEYYFLDGGELSVLEESCFVPLMIKYPVWIRRLVECTVSFTGFIEEMLTRLRTDMPLDILVKLSPTGADSHNHGRRVLFLTFAGGKKLLYKPHPLDTDGGWNRICRWIGLHTGTYIPYIPVKNHGAYGYAAFLSYKNLPPAKYPEFFSHAGMLLCVVYWLKGTDMHYENVITHGSWPYLADLELLTGEKENFTVSDTAMLCFPKYRDGRLIDDFGAYTNKDPRWNHLPKEGGEVVTAARYLEEICGGFETMYQLLSGSRREEAGLCLSCSPRYVFRPTSYYTALLRRLNAADTLKDGQVFYQTARESLLREGGGINPAILKSELEAILRNDIPIFYHAVETRDLYNEEGLIVSGYFYGRPGDVLVRDFTNEDLKQQIALIREGVVPVKGGATDGNEGL